MRRKLSFSRDGLAHPIGFAYYSEGVLARQRLLGLRIYPERANVSVVRRPLHSRVRLQ